MRKHWYFLFLTLLISQTLLTSQISFAQNQKDIFLEELANSNQWRRLLHYKKTNPFTKKEHSQIDSKEYFIHPDGKSNPLSELKATIEAFQNPLAKHESKTIQHPQCAFPARLEFLEHHFTFPRITCTELDEWFKGLNVQSVYLVFSTAYPNNPASTFGHTFLRLSLSDNRSDLLDYAINFSADTFNVTSGLYYTLMGMFGGFKGYYSLEKYYLKVNDYNNQESRDLWEYKLDFSQQEIQTLLKHFWELYSNAHIDYYFMDENCSYHLLTLLEVAKPHWNISEPFHHPWIPSYTMPSDTVKETLKFSPNFTTEFKHSKRKKLIQKRDALTSEEKDVFYKVLSHKIDIKTITNPFLLDTLIEYYDYKKRENKIALDSEDQKFLSQILVQRSSLGLTPPRVLKDLDTSNRPDLSHGSASVGLITGLRDGYGNMGFKYKFGLHDLLDGNLGFDPYTHIDYFNFDILYSFHSKNLYIDKAKYIDIKSINVYDPIEWKWSWRILLQSESLESSLCEGCYKHYGLGGFGAAYEIINKKLLLYGYLLAKAQYSKALTKEFQIGPALESGLLLTLTPKLKSQIKFLAFDNLNNSSLTTLYKTYEIDLGYQVSQSWHLRLSTLINPKPINSLNTYYDSSFLIRYDY